jgi:hypothetical protein
MVEAVVDRYETLELAFLNGLSTTPTYGDVLRCGSESLAEAHGPTRGTVK